MSVSTPNSPILKRSYNHPGKGSIPTAPSMVSHQSQFNTNCTIPSHQYAFVASPDSRGTFDILWNCLTVLFLCTWSVQHPPVPAQRISRNWKQKLRNTTSETLQKFGWMLLTLIFPEIMVGLALVDWCSARESARAMKEIAALDGVEWTRIHGFYSDMGGFVISFNEQKLAPPSIGATRVGSAPMPTSERLHSTSLEITSTSSSCTSLPCCNSLATCERLVQEDSVGIETCGQHRDDVEVPDSTPSIQEPDVESADLGGNLNCPPSSCSTSAMDLERACTPTRNRKATAASDSSERAIFKYIHFNDINNRKQTFYNGKELLNPAFARIKDADDSNIESTSSTINCDIASQALPFLATKHPEMLRNYFVCLSRLQGDSWALDARQLYLARTFGIIKTLPSVSEDEIKDQSKSDAMLKGIAMFQASYLCLQLALRQLQDLPSSQLELMAAAFVPCAFIAYILSFFKPQNVKVPRIIEASRWPTPDEMVSLAEKGPQRFDLHSKHNPTYAMPNLNAHKYADGRRSILTFPIGYLATVAILSSIHCAAWFWEFPTSVEQLLWRICCVITLVTPALVKFIVLVDGVYVENPFPRCWIDLYKRLPNIGLGIFICEEAAWAFRMTHMAARLFMIVEAFRSLFFLPPGAFKATEWLAAWPSVGS